MSRAIVRSADWMGTIPAVSPESVRLLLLDDDLRGAQIALEDFERTRITGPPAEPVDVAVGRHIHYAKTFTCAMRRVGRNLESLASNRSAFPPSVSEAIKLAWRKRREMFESYVDPRNVIEHIPDEVGDKERWILMNLHGDVLVADEKSSAEVSRANLDRAVAARTEIVDALQANKGRGT